MRFKTPPPSFETISSQGLFVSYRDYRERTPLLLAAEAGRQEAARILLDFNAAAGVWDDTGTCCLTYMIDTMPDVASQAIEQFFYVNKGARTSEYYLSYLESKKWELERKGKKDT